MAGMEELEIHSRSYLVRWINVRSDHTISWSIQPHKKSLNFGIFKHPGHVGSLTSSLASSVLSEPSTFDFNGQAKENMKALNSSSTVTEKLKGMGIKLISWIGKCEADKVSQGTYDVGPNEGGNYALVFDNTFSKKISKTATFVLLTYPTHSPPQSGHQIHHSKAMGTTNVGITANRSSPKLKPSASDSTESLRHARGWGWSISGSHTKLSLHDPDSSTSFPAAVHTGILQKRRRKRHQGFARRFFSLDFRSSTLSYYHDRNSSALRGAIPLSLAVIAANSKSREISIDSGVEIWHLRATNDNDFNLWKRALEKASKISADGASPENEHNVHGAPLQRMGSSAAEDREWALVEGLVEKVSKSRDTIRRLAKDTDPKYLTPPFGPRGRSPSPGAQPILSAIEIDGDDIADSKEKRSFWKLKPGQNNTNNTQTTSRRNASSPLAVSRPGSENLLASLTPGEPSNNGQGETHEHLMALLHELNAVVSEFSALILESKHRRSAGEPCTRPRASIDSDASQEFFDAIDGNLSPLLTIQRDSDEEDERSEAAVTIDDDEDTLSGSDVDENSAFTRKRFRPDNSSYLFPVRPRSLAPLPLGTTSRRTNIPPPRVLPPSLIGFVRKNVGKDFSTISMPVSANEPLSLLQRAAEQFEYSDLLNKAANATDSLERLIYVTAFAISPHSNSRVKERAIRKPFNPMLGETFELVREDQGFRFIAEKVSHRPVQLACQADAKDWSFAQSPRPSQKFWGKSAEIITEGKARLTLHSSGERFSWSTATSVLRNVMAGEKYVEPVGEMCVLNETTGQKTITTFKAGGMFSGRSEDVSVKAFGTHDEELPLGLQGTWVSSLQLTEHGYQTNKNIWTAGPLVDGAPKHYGFTTFAASLNEITPIEQGKLPPTDSRLRPDQRTLEEGDLGRAEDLKAHLEDRQRQRRKEMEEKGEMWRPRWFTKVETDRDSGLGEEDVVWKLRMGKDGYWEERGRGEWSGTLPVFNL